MKYTSTRDPRHQVSLSEALLAGLAPDGGLYVPMQLNAGAAIGMPGNDSLHAVAEAWLTPYFDGDRLATELPAIIEEAFDFPAPLRRVDEGADAVSLLELFHGPTAAFKDFGARFLAACLARIHRDSGRLLTVLVATSGDTGAAVASAFHRRPGTRVVVLYPAGRISPVQQRQMAGLGDNVASYSVHGSFDDCQRLVKQAFADRTLPQRLALSSANSINIGRLLPQATYFAATSLALSQAEGRQIDFAIPSGNLGHATACAWARAAGLPIRRILLAHNANRAVPDFVASGKWQPRPGIATIASAMDIGDPSNMERLRHLHPKPAEFARQFLAVTIDDDHIRARIRAEFAGHGIALCPHTAAGMEAVRQLPGSARRNAHWVVAATAHPAKFPEIVEPLLGKSVAPPPELASLESSPAAAKVLDASYQALRAVLVAQ